MLNNVKNRKKEEGFTIIEVLIVLAIAGLILLIVFLAVPALQRNSRNTQYRTDASRILGATQEFINNNGGTQPVAADGTTIATLANTKSITTVTVRTAGAVTAITPTLTNAFLESGVKCGTVGGATLTPSTGSTRQMILVYAVEDSAGAVISQCTES